MKRALLGLYTYLEFGLTALVFVPLMGVVALVSKPDPGRRIRGRWMRRFGRTTSNLTSIWRFQVEGEGPPDVLTKPYVVVCNHESTADPFLLSHLPWDMRWVSKESIFKLPVIGWLMRLGGDIPLRRGESQSVVQMLNACKETLAAGMCVMIFPEGTRSADASLLPFKPGAFQLAIEAGVPVLPIALYGTHSCRPKGSIWFGQADAVVRVLKPISTQGMTSADVQRLSDLARAQIAEAVLELASRKGHGTPASGTAQAPVSG
jgi:1-acyl-sn-glycerol-3-phosphate acyltransferase